MVVPGTYQVALARRVEGEVTPLAEPQTFQAVALGSGSLPADDRDALLAFQRQTAKLQRAVLGAASALDEAHNRINHLKIALHDTPAADASLSDRLRTLETQLADLSLELLGDPVARSYAIPSRPSIMQRVDRVVSGHWASSTSAATGTHRRNYKIAVEAFGPLLEQFHELIGGELKAIEDELEAAGGPWTPGRLPVWEP